MSHLDGAIAATWVFAATTQIALVIVLCGRIHAILPATHALMFAIFLPLLGAGNAILTAVQGCDAVGLIGASIGATLYVALLLAITGQFPRLFSAEAWLPAIRASTGSWIVGCVASWVLVKIYLFAVYGVSAIRALGLLGPDSAYSTYAYWETIVNAA